MSVSGDILRSWRAPRQVVRDLLAQGQREDRAIAFLMIGCGLVFVAQWPRLIREAQVSDEIPLQAMLGGALLGWMFIAPLLLYGLAALIRLTLMALRLRLSWYGARLAVFWALLAVSPLWLLHGAVAGMVGPGPATNTLGAAVLAAFFWILAGGLGAAALEARDRSA